MRLFSSCGGSRLLFSTLLALGSACALPACSASGSSTPGGISQRSTSPDGSTAGGGLVIDVPPDPGAAGEDWPASACHGAIIDAVTGQYCQGPAYGIFP